MFFRRRVAGPNPTAANSAQSTDPNQDAPLPPEVEDVMAELSLGWDFMTRDDFNPVTLALELLDTSSNSRDLDTFQRFLGKLEKGMDLVVHEHYQAFNHSIETFGRVMDHILSVQQGVRGLQADLNKAKELLICKRPDLLQLWAKSAQYKEMIRMLSTIESLKKAPEQIQQLLQNRHYLNAVRALLSALKTINGSDFADVQALSDIRQTLYGIRGSMYETILDELHRCLYLKSAVFAKLNVNSLRFGEKSASMRRTRHEKQLSDTSDCSDLREANIVDDVDEDPESDPMQFLVLLLTSLNLLGKSEAIKVVLKQRSTLEVFKLIDRILEDVVTTVSAQVRESTQSSTNSHLLDALTPAVKNPLGMNASDNYILEKFISTLYERLELSMELHRFAITSILIQNQSNSLASNEDRQKAARMYMFDLWTNVQEQVKAVLLNYVAANKNPYLISAQTKSDKVDRVTERRVLFQFSESTVGQEVQAMSAANTSTDVDALGVVGIVDRLAICNSKATHRLVASPSIFNLPVLFQPTVEFVNRVELAFQFRVDKKPDLLVFVEDILLKDFITHVEDIVIQKFHEAVNSIDSYRVDKFDIADRPVFKSVVLLVDLIKEFLVAVYRISSHEDEFIRIVETVLAKFYDRCLFRVKNALGMNEEEGSVPLLSTIFAGTDEIEVLYKQNTLLRNPDNPDTSRNQEIGKQILAVESDLKSSLEVKREALLFDGKRLNFLANTRTSLAWFVKQIELIRRRGSFNSISIEIRPPSEVLTRSQHAFNMDLLLSRKDQFKGTFSEYPFAFLKEAICFSLPEEATSRLDTIIQNFLGLSWQTLFILKSELRCHCYFFVESCTVEGNFAPNEPASEPDPYIFAMNQDTTNFDKLVSRALSINERTFIFESIADLISTSLVENSDHITEYNQFGVEKMIKNILATQQNLSNIIGSEARLDFAKKYYQLFFSTGPEIIRSVEQNGPVYTEDQYLAVLGFIYRKAISIPDHPQKPEYDQTVEQLSRLCSQ